MGDNTIALQVELYASLMKYLPPDSSRHRTQVRVAVDTTPHQLIDQLGIPRELAHLVLKNGTYVLPLERNQAIFADGDLFALWPPVAGG